MFDTISVILTSSLFYALVVFSQFPYFFLLLYETPFFELDILSVHELNMQPICVAVTMSMRLSIPSQTYQKNR